MTDFHGIDENTYQQIQTETMTNLIETLYINAYVDSHIAVQEAKDNLPDPLPAIYVHNIRQSAMDRFNTWLRKIRTSDN